MRAGRTFISQIKDAITSAFVHVAIFSPRYAESEWCLNELLDMLESKSVIIPVFYQVEPATVRWPDGKGVYAEALRILENKKISDSQKPRHDPATIKKWKEALSTVSEISGFDLGAGPFYGDEGELVEKIVERVLEEIKSTSGFYCTQLYGGSGGNYWNDGTYSGIRGITMTAQNNSLTSVQLYYALESKNGNIPGHRYGNEVGDKMEYTLNYPEEIVTKISGYIEISGLAITSLTFHTNQRILGPCGQEQGTPFETEEKGKIVGIFGSSGSLVDSIGAFMLKPRTATDKEFYCSRVYGGHGNNWTDGTYSGVRRIIVTANEHALTSFQMHYGLEGDDGFKDRIFYSHLHGGTVGRPHQGALGNRSEYSLNYPDEMLTKISGHFGNYKAWPEGWVVIKSLTFHTNKAKYGPCGQEQGTPFETEEGGKIVGFFGSSGTLLDSIGVYMLKPR